MYFFVIPAPFLSFRLPFCHSGSLFVIPAKAGIQYFQLVATTKDDELVKSRKVPFFVIPAKAGHVVKL